MVTTRKRKTQTSTSTEWCVGVCSGDTIDGYRLEVFRWRDETSPVKLQRGEGDGKVFATREAADLYALEHGYSAPYFSRVWCSECRTLHVFLGRPTPFCPEHGFIG
jgi:hypothetical protein